MKVHKKPSTVSEFASELLTKCSTVTDAEQVAKVIQLLDSVLDGRLSSIINEALQAGYTILEPGHQYKLTSNETITFLKRSGGKLVHDGITNEELLLVLLDRMRYLQGKLPCRENSLAITKLEEARFWLHDRTRKRVAQKIETTDTPHND
jgi:hypothetical protein